jgi:opacity protein-like surface antigen
MSGRTHVRTALLTGAALAALSLPAGAGILDPAPAYPVATPPTFAPIHDWTGFYAGLSGGATWGSAKWESDPDLTQGTVSGSSGLIGGSIGYNSQTLGRFVLGEEFDFSYRPYNFTIPAATCIPNCTLTSSWVSTARLRFGYSVGTFMPYVTGGLSMSDFQASAAGQPFGTNNNVTFNWVVGAGLEFLISGPWSGKIEYLFVNHTRFACDTECNGPVNLSVSENVFRVGVNYRLGGW